jgi:DNA-binding NarL/FixJ family response regulator
MLWFLAQKKGEVMARANLIRVLIADDHSMVRQGLRSALQAYPNIEVVGEARDGNEAIEAVYNLQPSVIVMDINMSRMDGITATRLIKTQHPETVVIGLSAILKDYEVYAMQKAGAFEVLHKDNAVTELYSSIQRAIASIQPILILEDTAASPESIVQLGESSSNPKDVLSLVEEPNKVTEREPDTET